uniref:GCR153 n=1 Tax=Schmidtea mediterranea TaxID=79327 RepID=A0A193KUF4_SCHMD|nr:GCR153 [Schmidtea mediterranea]
MLDGIQTYNSNYYEAYRFIMNAYVPSVCIFSSMVGIIICILLWCIIYHEVRNPLSIIQPYLRDVLVAFTFTNTIGQIVAMISSIAFLCYFKCMYAKTSDYNNNGARFLGMMYVWIRLSNSFLIWLMLFKSLTKNPFSYWNQLLISSVFGPFFISIAALYMDVTGFHYSQLPLGSCSIVMVPKSPTFINCIIWIYCIEFFDLWLFVFNCLRIIKLKLDKMNRTSNPEVFEIMGNRRDKLIPDAKHLLAYISCVMMIAKSMEVIRIISVSCMFSEMNSDAAYRLGLFNVLMLLIQAMFEIAQPVLTYACVRTFLNMETSLFRCLKPINENVEPN